ncbi:methionine--tRNA ligase [Candidatus Kapabacteria bacterium]|nr:methionine--tRNA ligase [Candidatus Kapabacteria bacterium]
MKKYLLTSALPYSNGYLHLGHLAGAYLPADLFARFKRLNSEEVLYVCGSDEHGVAITIAAEKEGVTPQDIIDKYHFANKSAFEGLNISFDIYSRTSNELHHNTAREFFADFIKKGFLEKKESEQFYDETANMFLPDRYVEGICPSCGKEDARGDQCDNCGAYYSQTELKNPISLISKKPPLLKKTVHWYFKFGDFQDFLENYINQNEEAWKDNVINQTRSWLKAGLSERAITRDLNWGVKIDNIEGVDPEEAATKRLYVWFDAVLGYISATKEYFGNDDWKQWWQSADTDYIAFIGKDNIVFHTLIFPAMLHARSDENNPYLLPKNVPAHEFLNLEGQKFSKSKNWSIDLKDFLDDFKNPTYVDVLRYSIAMSFPETRDADFTWKDFVARNNNELASIFGNFINRTLQFSHKNFEGKIPKLSGNYQDFDNQWNNAVEQNQFDQLESNDKDLLEKVIAELSSVQESYNKYRFRDAITSSMNIARAANKYFNDEEPWKSVKSNPELAAKSLFVCCQLAYNLSILLSPIIPNSAKYIMDLFSSENYTGESNGKLKQATNYWEKITKLNFKSGTAIQKPEIIFGRLDDSFADKQMQKLGDKNNNSSKEVFENVITIDEFFNVKLRTAKVISAEKIKKSDKLLKLIVDLGGEQRQIIAGIAKYYSTEEIVNKYIIVVANLKPAKLMGELSEGMLLAANFKKGLKLATFDGEIPLGAEVR